jgi:4-diphosphocytidyl-2-C-methyl-D-erythritol kinase
MDSIRLKAYAKINLGLEVLGRREDGYHEVQTILQTVSLHDKITIKLQNEGIKIRSNSPWVPCNEKNLAYKAAALMLKRSKSKSGVKITIKKNIPIGAGLGGGSSNGAAVLIGLTDLLNLTLSDEELQDMGRELGTDVPFFLRGGTALASGRGDQLRFFEATPCFWGLIVFPNFSVPTDWAYSSLGPQPKSASNMKMLISATQEGDVEGIAANLQNTFESTIFRKYPTLRAMKNGLIGKGAVGASLSGSGSSLFGIFADKETAERALFHFSDSGYAAWIIRSCTND